MNHNGLIFRLDIATVNKWQKYRYILDFYKTVFGIDNNDSPKRLLLLQSLIHSTQDNFPLKINELANIGDAYLTFILSLNTFNTCANVKEMQDMRTGFTNNKYLAKKFDILTKHYQNISNQNRIIIPATQCNNSNDIHKSTALEAIIGTLIQLQEYEKLQKLTTFIFTEVDFAHFSFI
jgi:23S rRNA maturation mini-RNase III